MITKNNIILFVFFLQSIFVLGQVPDFVWAKKAGGTSSDYGISIVVDDMGYTYVTGRFQETSTFGDIELTTTSSGASDGFIAKMDMAGNFIWAKKVGGVYTDISNGIALDASGNVYIIGNFFGTATFGNIELTAVAGSDVFITKLDTDGNFIWAKRAGEDQTDIGLDIVVGESGNIYVTGISWEATSFGDVELIGSQSSKFFIAKLDTEGNFIWAKRAGGSIGQSFGHRDSSIIVDFSENVYLTGRFNQGTATFGDIVLTASENSTFVTKLDLNGNFIWANKGIGGTPSEITVDALGNTYITGGFQATISFGNFELTSPVGVYSSFITKLDTNGNFIWVRKVGGILGTASGTHATGIISDSLGNVFITGYFRGTVYFGNIALVATSWQVSSDDVYVAKLDTEGNFIWVKKGGGSFLDRACDIAIDSFENIYITGEFPLTTSFGNITLTSSGNNDIFILKIGDPCTPPLTASAEFNENILSATLTPTVISAAYQWINCDNQNESVEGETNQTFIPTENGNYAVEITVLSCVLTSECITVNNLSTKENELQILQLFPNPSNGLFVLQGEILNENTVIRITNTLGQEIKKIAAISGSTVEIDLTKEENGVYFLKTDNGKVSRGFKIIKN